MDYANLSDVVRSSIAERFGCRVTKKDLSSTPYRGDVEYMFKFFIRDGSREFISGNAKVEVNRSRREISWLEFFPLDFLYGATGKGLGTLLHVLTLLKLLENEVGIWDYDVIHTSIDDHSRWVQLTKMRITRIHADLFREKFDSYLRKSVAYLRGIGMDIKFPDYVLQRI